MLHKSESIIEPNTFKLIQVLQSNPTLDGFHLVGGTALALQLGHRNSIDIDLFTQYEFQVSDIVKFLSKDYDYKEKFKRKSTLICFLNGVKTDFIQHDYPYIHPPFTEEGIRMLSKEDIAAMKLNAIINSGQRLKDFIDIYYLLEHFHLENMLDFFRIKYAHSNPLIALKAVTYFEDIDTNIDPPMLIFPLSLKEIKNRILDAAIHTKKIYA